MNCYEILDLTKYANLLEICTSYQVKCLKHPENTLLYTKALNILINPLKRIIYDSNTFQINLPTLIQNSQIYEVYQNIDEYDLLDFITWFSYFKDYFYDTKYFTNN